MTEQPQSDLILDHLEPLKVSAARRAALHNHLQCADRLAIGMDEIYHEVGRIAGEAERILGLPKGSDYTMSMGVPGWQRVTNLFDWYAVSAHRFFILIGTLADAHAGPDLAKSAKAYAKRVCGPLRIYRHKRGA